MKKLPAYPVYLLLSAGQSFVFALIFAFDMVYQVNVVGLSALQLVLVGTFLETTTFLFEVPTGIVADTYSRRLSVIIGFFLIGIGFLVEGSFPAFALVLLAQFFWGVGYTFTSGATDAWIADEVGEEAAGQAYLRGAQAYQIGGLVGFLVSMPLANQRLSLPILTGGGLFIFLALFLVLFMPETGFRPTPREERNNWQQMGHTFRQGLGMIRRRPILLSILGIGLFYGLYSEGYDRLWTKQILDNFTLPPFGSMDPVMWFGVLRAAGLLASLGVTEVVRRWVNTTQSNSIARWLLFFTLALIAGLFGFAWAQSLGVVLALFWVIYIARAVISPLYTTWVNQRLDPGVRATVLSMTGQVDAIGQIAGGPVVGLIGQFASVRWAISSTAFILSPVVLLFARLLRSGPEPLPAESTD